MADETMNAQPIIDEFLKVYNSDRLKKTNADIPITLSGLEYILECDYNKIDIGIRKRIRVIWEDNESKKIKDLLKKLING